MVQLVSDMYSTVDDGHIRRFKSGSRIERAVLSVEKCSSARGRRSSLWVSGVSMVDISIRVEYSVVFGFRECAICKDNKVISGYNK